jgi:hypothetical protein
MRFSEAGKLDHPGKDYSFIIGEEVARASPWPPA